MSDYIKVHFKDGFRLPLEVRCTKVPDKQAEYIFIQGYCECGHSYGDPNHITRFAIDRDEVFMIEEYSK